MCGTANKLAQRCQLFRLHQLCLQQLQVFKRSLEELEVAMIRLSVEKVRALDPYAFLAVLGKRVIHPGGRASTDLLLT